MQIELGSKSSKRTSATNAATNTAPLPTSPSISTAPRVKSTSNSRTSRVATTHSRVSKVATSAVALSVLSQSLMRSTTVSFPKLLDFEGLHQVRINVQNIDDTLPAKPCCRWVPVLAKTCRQSSCWLLLRSLLRFSRRSVALACRLRVTTIDCIWVEWSGFDGTLRWRFSSMDMVQRGVSWEVPGCARMAFN